MSLIPPAIGLPFPIYSIKPRPRAASKGSSTTSIGSLSVHLLRDSNAKMLLRQTTRLARAAKPLSSLAQSRLASSLVYLEHKGGKLNDSSLHAVTAAQKVDGEVSCSPTGTGLEVTLADSWSGRRVKKRHRQRARRSKEVSQSSQNDRQIDLAGSTVCLRSTLLHQTRTPIRSLRVSELACHGLAIAGLTDQMSLLSWPNSYHLNPSPTFSLPIPLSPRTSFRVSRVL